METKLNNKISKLSSLCSLDFLWLELTRKCNLNCVHCYAESSPKISLSSSKMQIADWKRVINEAFEYGCRKLQFIGGEATIYPHLTELIEYSSGVGYEYIELFTNGINFSDSLKNILVKYNIKLAFSVYSADSKVHDEITKLSGSQKKTLENIRWSIENFLNIRVAIVDVGTNSDTVEDTKSLLKNMGVENIAVDKTRGVGRGNDSVQTQSPVDELCGNCWKGKLCVTASGEIYPCVFSRFWSVGNASDGLDKVLKSDSLLEFRLNQKGKYEVSPDSHSNCHPQCGPACTPDECSPQSDCNPFCGPGHVPNQ